MKRFVKERPLTILHFPSVKPQFANNMTPAPAIIILPDEIWLKIFEYLEQADIATICLVSSSLLPAARSALYRIPRLTRQRRNSDSWEMMPRARSRSSSYRSNSTPVQVKRSFWDTLMDSLKVKFTAKNKETHSLFISTITGFKDETRFTMDLGLLVRELDLSHLNVEDDQVALLLERCKCLKRLNLADTAVSDETLELLPKTLTSLSVAGCAISDNALESISRLSELVSLNLKHTEVTDKGIQHLSQLKRLQRLRVFGCKQLTNESMKSIASCQLLQWLDVGECPNIGDDGIIQVALNCKRIQWLDISRPTEGDHRCQVTDKGLRVVVENLKQIELLDLAYCTQLTDEGLKAVAIDCVNLKSLSLKGMDLVTKESILELGELRRKYKKLIWLQIYQCQNITSKVIDEMISKLNDGWRKGPYNQNIHKEVMNGSWEDI